MGPLKNHGNLLPLVTFINGVMCCIFRPAFGVRNTQTLVEIFNSHVKRERGGWTFRDKSI